MIFIPKLRHLKLRHPKLRHLKLSHLNQRHLNSEAKASEANSPEVKASEPKASEAKASEAKASELLKLRHLKQRENVPKAFLEIAVNWYSDFFCRVRRIDHHNDFRSDFRSKLMSHKVERLVAGIVLLCYAMLDDLLTSMKQSGLGCYYLDQIVLRLLEVPMYSDTFLCPYRYSPPHHCQPSHTSSVSKCQKNKRQNS